MYLILDIDGTLISDNEPIIFRPYLSDFLNSCFDIFDTVSIWSAASEDHVKSIAEQILPLDQQWLFVRHSKHCHKKYSSGFVGIYGGVITEKRLRNIWKSKTYRGLGITKTNTIIIDNTPSVCIRNYGNAIYVETFIEDPKDDELLKLIPYLKNLIQHENVRTIEKRNWKIKC